MESSAPSSTSRESHLDKASSTSSSTLLAKSSLDYEQSETFLSFDKKYPSDSSLELDSSLNARCKSLCIICFCSANFLVMKQDFMDCFVKPGDLYIYAPFIKEYKTLNKNTSVFSITFEFLNLPKDKNFCETFNNRFCEGAKVHNSQGNNFFLRTKLKEACFYLLKLFPLPLPIDKAFIRDIVQRNEWGQCKKVLLQKHKLHPGKLGLAEIIVKDANKDCIPPFIVVNEKKVRITIEDWKVNLIDKKLNLSTNDEQSWYDAVDGVEKRESLAGSGVNDNFDSPNSWNYQQNRKSMSSKCFTTRGNKSVKDLNPNTRITNATRKQSFKASRRLSFPKSEFLRPFIKRLNSSSISQNLKKSPMYYLGSPKKSIMKKKVSFSQKNEDFPQVVKSLKQENFVPPTLDELKMLGQEKYTPLKKRKESLSEHFQKEIEMIKTGSKEEESYF